MAYGRNRKKLQIKLIGLIGVVLVMALMQSDFYDRSYLDRTMNYNNKTLEVGERFRLRPRQMFYGKISYSSKDVRIAIVYPNGMVEALQPGRTVVIARMNGKEYYCNVRVRPD